MVKPFDMFCPDLCESTFSRAIIELQHYELSNTPVGLPRRNPVGTPHQNTDFQVIGTALIKSVVRRRVPFLTPYQDDIR